MTNEEREARRLYWKSLADCGASRQDIAEAFGVSRERVRQVIGNHGGAVKPDPLRVVRMVRTDRTIRGWRTLALRSGHPLTTLRPMLVTLGLDAPIGRLLRWRKRAMWRGKRKHEGDYAQRRKAARLAMQARARANGTIPHGTPSGYGNYRCRCDACRAAWTPYSRRVRRSAAAKAKQRGCPMEKHGTLSGYQYYGCRCQGCRAAQRDYGRARYAATKAAP